MCWVQCIHDGIISGIKILQRNLLPWKGRTCPDQWSHSLQWKITRDSFCAGITLCKLQKEEKCCFKFYLASQWHHTVSLNTGWTSMDMWRLDRGVRYIFGPWYWEHQVAITQNFHLPTVHIASSSWAWLTYAVTTTALCDNASCSSLGPGVTELMAISQHTGKPSCIPHQVSRVRMLHSLSNKMHTLAVLNWWKALHGNLYQKF